jgi:hypothetical protein
VIAPEYLLRCDPTSIRGNLHLDFAFDTEMNAAFTLTIVPLVPNAALPRSASARTRLAVPPGYGVQEQCLPFTAASALGVLIPSPIRFGYCIPDDVPKGCRTFRSPLDKPMADGRWADPRVFYVFDNPECRFVGNAYDFTGVSVSGSTSCSVQEPGLSFFDRDDQRSLLKLHLPYVWRTPESLDTLFLPLLNCCAHFEVKCGLVETDWYNSPVNLVLGMSPGPTHVRIGDPVAQAIFVPRNLRQPTLDFVPESSQLSLDVRAGLAEWDKLHAENRSAYKLLVRSARGTSPELPSDRMSGESESLG